MAVAEPLSLRWAQGEVFKADERFRVLVAGRRFLFPYSFIIPDNSYITRAYALFVTKLNKGGSVAKKFLFLA